MRAPTKAEVAQEMSKVAVSVGRALAAIRGRVAQGAKVAPGIMADIERQAAAGATSTPRNVRNIALNAAQDIASQRAMHTSVSNPVTRAARGRLAEGWEAAVERRPGVFDRKSPLPHHYDHGAAGRTAYPIGYTQEHIDSLMGPSQLMGTERFGISKVGPAQPARNTAITVATRVGKGMKQ